MKDQVLSIEQMQHIKELGVDTSKASLYWVKYKQIDDEIIFLCTKELLPQYQDNPVLKCEIIPTYTLQDILDLFPVLYFYEGKIHIDPPRDAAICYEGLYPSLHFMGEWEFAYRNDKGNVYGSSFFGSDAMEVCYKGLCRIAKDKLLGKEENK